MATSPRRICSKKPCDLSYPTAFVRPGSLNALQQAEATGSFDIFLAPTDRKVPMAATADTGAEIARLLVGMWSGKKIVELGSRYSPDDLAHALTEVLGHSVQVRAVSRDQLRCFCPQSPGGQATHLFSSDGSMNRSPGASRGRSLSEVLGKEPNLHVHGRPFASALVCRR